MNQIKRKNRDNLPMLKFRLNLRNTLRNQSIELVKITLEESKREIDRRN